MPVTDLSCGTLRWQPLPRNCGLRTTTHVHRYIRFLELASSVYGSWPLSRSGWKSISVFTQFYRLWASSSSNKFN